MDTRAKASNGPVPDARTPAESRAFFAQPPSPTDASALLRAEQATLARQALALAYAQPGQRSTGLLVDMPV